MISGPSASAQYGQSSIKNCQFLAPAKLNIRLKVTGRRPDGYHELVTIMIPVSLFDKIVLEMNSLQRIVLSCQGLSVPNDEDNLVYRAARAFYSKTGINPGVSIRLIKNIPIAAGLGGGSSDAACTLKALNYMYSNPLTFQDLADMAVNLGADIPFFLNSRPCIARGIGEILEPIEKWPELWYVIVMPPFKISTSWAYSKHKLKLTTGEYEFILKHLKKEPLEIGIILENDLETVSVCHFPVINTIKNSLLDTGAEGALMSGSGPSVFGVFKTQEKAVLAQRRLIPQNLGDVFAVKG
jgi:4-diphosphocytidyl-2-C-methyl-D-erythritol kinase